MAVLYNEEDLKENSPGMTDEMRALLRSSSCLKQKLAEYFGYAHLIGVALLLVLRINISDIFW